MTESFPDELPTLAKTIDRALELADKTGAATVALHLARARDTLADLPWRRDHLSDLLDGPTQGSRDDGSD